jgi:hypothetical protein
VRPSDVLSWMAVDVGGPKEVHFGDLCDIRGHCTDDRVQKGRKSQRYDLRSYGRSLSPASGCLQPVDCESLLDISSSKVLHTLYSGT